MRISSNLTADPLSDLLDFLQARCDLSGRLVAGGSWARRFENMNAIKFCAITAGTCWYGMEGLPDEPAKLAAGDVLVMSGTHALVLASSPSLAGGAATMPLSRDADGSYRLGLGNDFTMLSGLVQIDADRQALLSSCLPPRIHVNRATEAAAPISWLIAQLVAETQPGSRPGQATVISGLAQLLFVQTLRAYLAHAPNDDRGWLKGFGDPRLAIALHCIHGDPARDWSLDELAKEAGMSRTSFAVRFRGMMGVPPLTYLTRWRMHLARRAIRAGASIAEAAATVGYSSESAFRSAFKRVMEMAPGQYRRTAGTEPCNGLLGDATDRDPDGPIAT